MAAVEHPYYPIIFIRGYAGNDDAIEETVATPYMGFDAGSTKLRQLWTGEVRRHYFESPLVRLMKDHGYSDVYSGGSEMPLELEVGPRSVFIYRYYDQMSNSLGTGAQASIEDFARGLSELILRIRDRICRADPQARGSFRVNLVAHSMGGLICRCFLQNEKCGAAEARALVHKVFTYATPHNGIDMQIVGNVPAFFTLNDANNFNRTRMRSYLGLMHDDTHDDVSSLNGKFPVDRFFCLVGTNAVDYTVANGWSRRFVGPMSDGLVRIANATCWSPGPDGQKEHTPRAFVYRSHSGHYGIVNSEEGYQNLTRFLFGDVRVDGVLDIAAVTLPQNIEEARAAGKTVRASYHFECVVRVRGASWDLHRRLVAENSAIFRTYDDMFRKENTRQPTLFSTFLSTKARVNKQRPSLGFCVDLAVRVPEYTIDGFLMLDSHYEGGFIFRDKLNLEATPPTAAGDPWKLRYGWDSESPNDTRHDAIATATPAGVTFQIPVEQKARPGLTARLTLVATTV